MKGNNMNIVEKMKDKLMESGQRYMAITGHRYYRSKNDIIQRKMYIWTEEGLIEDVYKANNKIASAYYKLLIDQLINYLLGNEPTQPVEDKGFIKQLKDVATNARIEGKQWMQAYVEDGEFKTIEVPNSELLPLYSDNTLVEMWRFYSEDEKEFALRYTKDEVIKYNQKGDVIKRLPSMQWKVTSAAGEEVKADSLGAVPFICMQANKGSIYDLESIKPLIDSYDIVLSDFANNLEDFQDVTWILKGYSGKNVSEFTKQVKMFKAIPVGEGGDAKPETIEIPHEARMAMLEKAENLIFKFGFGVNLDSMTGGSLTNVAIKSQFANLDMKANAFSQEVTQYINDYIELYNIWAAKANKPLIIEGEITYNKTIISNEVELLEANAKQAGFISNETRWDNHPWTDAETEERLLQGTLTIAEGDDDGQEE